MARIILDKYKNDPAWAETIKLYSGLFDTDIERKDFILEIADTDILLATECSNTELTANSQTEESLKDKLRKTSKNTLQQVASAINLNSINEISSSRKSIIIASKIANNLDDSTIIKICNHWVKSKVKGDFLILKKDLQQIKNILEKTTLKSLNESEKEFLDILINNVYSYLNQSDKLGVDVVKRVFDIISKFNYKTEEYAINTVSFLESKKSTKKRKVLEAYSSYKRNLAYKIERT
jgi:hypothetical protein